MSTSAGSFCLTLVLLAGVAPQVRADDSVRFVKVTGTANASVIPDTVAWNIVVSNSNEDLRIARDANDEITRKLLMFRVEFGIDAKDCQTGNLNIKKVYERDRNGNVGEFRHYVIERTVTLQQRDVSKFDDVLQKITSVAHVEVSYSLQSSEVELIRRETRIKAVKVAQEKAREMTEVLGATLGRVRTIEEAKLDNGWNSTALINNYAYYVDRGAAASNGGGTFASGTIDVQVSVEVSFAIE